MTERTEGWPVGLYLAALIAKDNDGEALVAGDDRYVADYLYREALHTASGVHAAVPAANRSARPTLRPICDALLDEADGAEQLRQARGVKHVLVPLDRRRGWYRYHALFREFLLGELGRVEPDVIPKLHLARGRLVRGQRDRRRWRSSTCCTRANGIDAFSW